MKIFEYIVLILILIAASVSDLRYRRVDDKLIIGGIVSKIVLVLTDGFLWEDMCISLAGGFGILIPLVLIVLVCEKIFKKSIMGGGDIKLLFLCGIYLGPDRIWEALMISSISLILFAVSDKEKKRDKRYPFVPFIAFGVLISVLLPAAVKIYNLACKI